MGKFVCILSVIFLTFVYQSLADVPSTTCSPSVEGDKTCKAVDPNAECPTGTTKCACKVDYFLSSDKTECLQKITTVECTAGTAGTTKCQQVDANSECPADGGICACKKEYKGTDSCKKVLGGTCPADGGCTGSVDNSVCAEQKCECAANFIEESAVCKTALGKDCSGTGQSSCVLNAECDKKECKCLSGFTNSNGLCAAESSATSAWLTTSLIVTSLLIYLPRLILL